MGCNALHFSPGEIEMAEKDFLEAKNELDLESEVTLVENVVSCVQEALDQQRHLLSERILILENPFNIPPVASGSRLLLSWVHSYYLPSSLLLASGTRVVSVISSLR